MLGSSFQLKEKLKKKEKMTQVRILMSLLYAARTTLIFGITSI
jgi:hypothetical protein